jgi:hypothetical protein
MRSAVFILRFWFLYTSQAEFVAFGRTSLSENISGGEVTDVLKSSSSF